MTDDPPNLLRSTREHAPLPAGAAPLPPTSPPPSAPPPVEPPRPRINRRALPSSNPRAILLLMWCVWLIGSWLVSQQYSRAAVSRTMTLSMLMGLMLAWPALRLSQFILLPLDRQSFHSVARPAPLRIIRTVLRDWLALNIVMQAVIWPLWLSAQWTVVQAMWLDMAIAAWSLLTAAFVAMGCRSPHVGQRCIAMALCVGLVVGEPLVMALFGARTAIGGDLPWSMHISPLETVWHLSNHQGLWTVEPWNWRVLATGVAALAAWVILIVWTHRQSARPANATRS